MDIKRHKKEILRGRLPKVDVLGVKIDDLSFENALFAIFTMAKDKKKSHFVATVNSEFVMMARRNKEFSRILANADLALADGIGVVISKLIFGGKFQARITGVELIGQLCKLVGDKTITVGFLGGFGDVAETVAKCQKQKNPQLKVVVSEAGDPDLGYDLRLRSKIEKTGRVDILFVAYGMAKQEFWIERQRKKGLDVGVYIGVGGAFDYLAGVKRRSPKLLQNWGMEWFWRLLYQPSRIWRMRVLPLFAILVIFSFLKKFLKNFSFL